MIIPSNGTERFGLFRNVIRQCQVSQERRKARNQQLRLAALSGSTTGALARYNKLIEWVQEASSYVYSPESPRFGIAFPPHYGESWTAEADAAAEEMHRMWHDTKASANADLIVQMAHIFDTAVGKVIVSAGEPTIEPVPEPADIGLWNEALEDWSEQEAICHTYLIDTARFARMVAHHPDRARLIEMAESHSSPGYGGASNQGLPSTVQGIIILSQFDPNMNGAVQMLANSALAIPEVSAPMLMLNELWIWDDKAGDYRVVQHMPATEEIIWDPPNPLVPGEHPFHNLTLMPWAGYAWGITPLQYLIKQQEWYIQKMDELDERQGKQIDPPLIINGSAGITDEQAKVFRVKGGTLASQNPMFKAEAFPPSPIADEFGILDRIEMNFSRQGGMPKIRAAAGEASMGRSSDQIISQALLTAGPALKHAIRVEDFIEAVSTQMLKLRRRTMDDTLQKVEKGEEHDFLLSQMPSDFRVRVWAHSASPLYRQQTEAKAKLAKEAGAIDSEDFLTYLDLPMTDVKLRKKARELDEAKAKRAAELLEIQKMKAEKKSK
jgi:hypothetical protein